MVSEVDVRARLMDTESRLQAIAQLIGPLQREVSSGTEGWQKALETLASCYKQRHELEVRRESLGWVLSLEQ